MNYPYRLLQAVEMRRRMNDLGKQSAPFFFIINYEADAGFVIGKDELTDDKIRFSFHEKIKHEHAAPAIQWQVQPTSINSYAEKFDFVKQQIQSGKINLINLTQATKITTQASLEQIYESAHAPYKLWFNDCFVVFSPETFIRICGDTISTYPMKGTIDASIPDAERLLLEDEKEKAEHAATVDLLCKDLSLVADDVQVKRFRYVEKITTMRHALLQVSSEVSGRLKADYKQSLGDLLFSLLPAGSICGLPKAEAIELIRKVEGYDRGFYTGVCGYFDGDNLDSAVMIRFVEQSADGLVFKSGGGITAQSELEKEYEELIQKIYVPVS